MGNRHALVSAITCKRCSQFCRLRVESYYQSRRLCANEERITKCTGIYLRIFEIPMQLSIWPTLRPSCLVSSPLHLFFCILLPVRPDGHHGVKTYDSRGAACVSRLQQPQHHLQAQYVWGTILRRTGDGIGGRKTGGHLSSGHQN